LAALAQLVSVAAIFASSGFLAGGGAIAPIAFFLAAIWVVAVSVLMMQRNGVPPVALTEP
jgi:hypothetical protein